MTFRLALALAVALALGGCTLFRGEGDESLSVHNRDVQPVNVIVQISQRDGNVPVLGESIRLNSGQTIAYALDMKPGEHSVVVTTSTSIQELLIVEIPKTGDTAIEITVRRGSATITTTSR